MDRNRAIWQHRWEILGAALVILALYLTSFLSFLLFHSLIELFTITVGAGVFVIAWNSRTFLNNNYLLFIGIASIFVSLIDVIHVLAYPGMGVFPGDTRNLSPQLWLAGRYLRTISWIIAPFLLGRRFSHRLQVGVYFLVTVGLLLSIFYWKVFPAAYLAGLGLTQFKIISEYVICVLLLVATGLLLRKREAFDPTVLQLLVASLLLTALAEMMFTSYISFYGPATVIGHLVRLVAYYLLYKAIIETGLAKPYALLLRDLRLSDDRRRQYAAALEEQNRDLIAIEGGLVDESTALRARNEELDAFAHTVAHDLKSPLAVIIGSSDVINRVKDLTRDELQHLLMQIKSTAFQMDGIIDNLLLLSEIRREEAPRQPVDMAAVVENVITRLSQQIKDNRARLTLPESWPTAMGYGPWIEEVWANYITNALKYGGPNPCIELGASIEPAGMVRFWTRDEGPGLRPEAQDVVFTPFTQRPKIGRKGHGLGLSIVLRIVQKLGGQVGFQSNGGRGTEFYFTLPAAA